MDANQLELFPLEPRNQGITRVECSQGGIRSLRIERFKKFENYEIDFDRVTLLVGNNSSGKTSLLQAVRLFFWCICKCIRDKNDEIALEKTVLPFSDFHLIPAHTLRELSYQGVSPNSQKRGIMIIGTLESGIELTFRIYASYSTLMVIKPENIPRGIDVQQLVQVNRQPLYIPGFFGVVNKELLAHDARLEELLNSGHHNEVLRNIVLRLKQEKLDELITLLETEFGITGLNLPFHPKESEYLKAEYNEPKNRIPFDFVSAGSGFLQVLQIMAHSLQNPSPVLLLDEPDAHMHHSLQKSFMTVLRKYAQEQSLQIVMASHSETFIRECELNEIRVIDSSSLHANSFSNALTLHDKLQNAGVWPTNLELTEIMRTKRVLLLENKEDEYTIDVLGRKIYNDWDSRRKYIQVIYTEGSNDAVVKRLDFVNSILRDIIPGIKVAHLRDRDLLCDEAVNQNIKEAGDKGLPLFISEHRNRETMFIKAEIIGRVINNEIDQLDSYIENEICTWCEGCKDEIPDKVKEYNLSWVRNNFPHEKKQKGDEYVTKFLRECWLEPLFSKMVPWKLIDGKQILKNIRRGLQDNYHLVIHDNMILDNMKKEEFDPAMQLLVKELYSWI